ncbi:MAG: amidohydrolase, partial [Clostridia bacterium]|nr:amidohydrolase [Clostridia bacterium]
MIIRNGTVYDAVHAKPYVADIVIRGGKIAAIGETIAAEDNEHVIDAAGMRVYPGLVEAHCHVGLH